MKKNAAVIGYGGMGAGFHCKNLLTSDVCNLAGIYDIDPAKRELAASRGVKVYNTREELLADPSIDLVTIATPNELHKPLAIKAMAAGKNVISEKPVTMNSGELEEIMAVVKETGKTFTIDQNRRTNRDFVLMRRNAESGIIGKPIVIESRVEGSRGMPRGWRTLKELGGGAAYDLLVYCYELMEYFMGIPEKVENVAVHWASTGVDETETVTLRYPWGLATLTASIGVRLDERTVLMGDKVDGRKEFLAKYANFNKKDSFMEQLEKKVDLHNGAVERLYKVERHLEVDDEKIKIINHRIEDLEGYHK